MFLKLLIIFTGSLSAFPITGRALFLSRELLFLSVTSLTKWLYVVGSGPIVFVYVKFLADVPKTALGSFFSRFVDIL